MKNRQLSVGDRVRIVYNPKDYSIALVELEGIISSIIRKNKKCELVVNNIPIEIDITREDEYKIYINEWREL